MAKQVIAKAGCSFQPEARSNPSASRAERELMMNNNSHSHYLVACYTTHQPDGVHIEAHCTCGEKLEGVGENEGAA
jgi:hypothetical protein